MGEVNNSCEGRKEDRSIDGLRSVQEQLIEEFKAVGQVVGFRCVASSVFPVRKLILLGLFLTEIQGSRAAMVSANLQVRLF